MRRLGLLAALWLGACRYGIDPDSDGGFFVCASNADCGGWHCNSACEVEGFTPYCVPNDQCDPCPSFTSDPQHCGNCATVCAQGQNCINRTCVDTAP